MIPINEVVRCLEEGIIASPAEAVWRWSTARASLVPTAAHSAGWIHRAARNILIWRSGINTSARCICEVPEGLRNKARHNERIIPG